MDDKKIAVEVKDLYKSFKLPHDQHSGIKQLLVNFHKRDKGYELQNVQKGISFDIKEGEFFGIVGRNGSGKSTLLKLLAGIYAPDKGLVKVNGSLTPFIELGVGFNPELTGRENVFLNGALLGFSHKEMEGMYDDIVEFAELDKFMDQKLKNYSSGMQVRLAFSIAIRAQSDILLLDEVLAVGDEAFQRKCFDYFRTLKERNQTVILVTHDMSSVKNFCTRAMLLEKGEIKMIGNPEDIANQYTADNFGITESGRDRVKNKKEDDIFLGYPVSELQLTNLSKKLLKSGDDLFFEIIYKLEEDLDVYIGIGIQSNGVSLVEHNSLGIQPVDLNDGRKKLTYRLPLNFLNEGEFKLNATVLDLKTQNFIAYTKNEGNLSFIVKPDNGHDKKTKGGMLRSYGSWK